MSGSSMLLVLLCWCVGVTVLLYVLYSWLIPTAVQFNGSLALLWHDVIVERALDTLTRSTRPQVTQSVLVKQLSMTKITTCTLFATRMHNGILRLKKFNDVKDFWGPWSKQSHHQTSLFFVVTSVCWKQYGNVQREVTLRVWSRPLIISADTANGLWTLEMRKVYILSLIKRFSSSQHIYIYDFWRIMWNWRL